MEHLLKTFPNRKFDANIVKAKDIFIYTSNKKINGYDWWFYWSCNLRVGDQKY